MEENHGEFAPVLWRCLKMKIRKQRPIYCRLPIADCRLMNLNRKSKIGNRKSYGGFILVFVIVAILIIGIEMYVLAGMANTMQYQSHRAYLNACERNLQASGLVWAKENTSKNSQANPGQTIELDVSQLNIIHPTLKVTLGALTDNGRDVRIHTSCSRGRQTLKENRTYKIKEQDQ